MAPKKGRGGGASGGCPTRKATPTKARAPDDESSRPARKATPTKKRPTAASSSSTTKDEMHELALLFDRTLIYHCLLTSGTVRVAAETNEEFADFALKKACRDVGFPDSSRFKASLSSNGKGKVHRAGTDLRKGMQACLSGAPPQEVIASCVASGPRREALRDADLIDDRGEPTAAAANGLLDLQAQLDYTATKDGVNPDAAVRYAEWAASREEDVRAEAARALELLNEEFDSGR